MRTPLNRDRANLQSTRAGRPRKFYQTNSWEDYYRVTYEIEGRTAPDEAAKKRRTWHPASRDYVMAEDEDAPKTIETQDVPRTRRAGRPRDF